MNESDLDAWFARARGAGAEPADAMPAGFAEAVWQGHLRQRAQGRAAGQTSAASLVAALLLLAAVVGWGYGVADRTGDDPSEEVPGSVWDIAGD